MKERRGLALVLAAAAAFAGVQIWIGIWRYDIYRAGVDDGIFTQVVLSTGGCFCAAAEGWANHLLVHWSPILILGYPFVRLFGDARGLIVLQALAVGATAFPLYAIARLYLDETRAAGVAAAAMVYPVLWQQTFTEFHENAYVPALAATLAWSILARRWRWGAVATAGLLLVKEDQAVLLTAMGLLIALVWNRDREVRRLGFCISGAAVITGLLYFLVVRPAFHSGIPYAALGFFDWRPNAPAAGRLDVLATQRVQYVFWALLPLLFIPLGSRLFLLALFPLGEVLAARYEIILVFGTQYSMLWSGYMLAAFAESAARMMQRRPRLGTLAMGGTLVVSLATFHRDPLVLKYYTYRRPNAHDAALDSLLASLPKGATISGTDEIYAHLAVRPRASHMLGGDYFVADTQGEDPTWVSRDKPALEAAIRAGTYRIVYDRDGIIVAKKAP